MENNKTPIQQNNQSPLINSSITESAQSDSNRTSLNFGSKKFIGLIVVLAVAVVGVIGYYLISQTARSSNAQVPREKPTLESVLNPTVAPTPKNELEQIDQIDTTFPNSDVNAVQKDLQGL